MIKGAACTDSLQSTSKNKLIPSEQHAAYGCVSRCGSRTLRRFSLNFSMLCFKLKPSTRNATAPLHVDKQYRMYSGCTVTLAMCTLPAACNSRINTRHAPRCGLQAASILRNASSAWPWCPQVWYPYAHAWPSLNTLVRHEALRPTSQLCTPHCAAIQAICTCAVTHIRVR